VVKAAARNGDEVVRLLVGRDENIFIKEEMVSGAAGKLTEWKGCNVAVV
jgi:hypothetical protein